MKVFIIFTLYLISGVSTNEVTAYSGGGVKIKCKYHEGYETNNKYFCKGKGTSCADQIKAGVKHTWVHEGRFSLYDNTSAKVFWVLMRNLTVEDTGTYQCAVDIKAKLDTYTEVEMNVKAEYYYGRFISETRYVGGSVDISCSYPESQRSDPKFLCKRVDIGICAYRAAVKESGRWINEGHISLYDDRTNQILTVTIREVTEQDSGTYWCGAESDWESDHGYMVYMTQIYLSVTATAFPGMVVYSSIAASLVLVTAAVITAFYCKMKRKGPETLTHSRETIEEYVNVSTLSVSQQTENKQPESIYENFNPTINQCKNI
ncbi:polymeric immunoglobulin receptor-like [Brachyhypopomus gauderio]|uniref:polymeric immunoglobulin receptor-like n=1 Tax=Brachyhypopomus gauderio TaxID=698409 RepID=UPI0040429C6C